MVKGNCKQVIVVQSPDRKLFEQAIFILKDDAAGVSDAELMREANKLLETDVFSRLRHSRLVWGCSGAVLTGLIWLICSMI